MMDLKQLKARLLEAHGPLSPSEEVIVQTAFNLLAATPVHDRYKHYKGAYYDRQNDARLSVKEGTVLREGDNLVIYEDVKGRWHARLEREFLETMPDGDFRFTLIRKASSAAGKFFVSDFRWLDEPCIVTGGDYKYTGQALLTFPKGEGGPVRYIVMDQNRRLFIHNGDQVNLRVRRDELGRIVEDNTP